MVLLVAFSGCELIYREKNFIGRSSKEIREKYGKFDYWTSLQEAPGLWRNCVCGYMIHDKHVGYLGTVPPKYFMIYFNEDGIAYKCQIESYYPGG